MHFLGFNFSSHSSSLARASKPWPDGFCNGGKKVREVQNGRLVVGCTELQQQQREKESRRIVIREVLIAVTSDANSRERFFRVGNRHGRILKNCVALRFVLSFTGYVHRWLCRLQLRGWIHCRKIANPNSSTHLKAALFLSDAKIP